MNNLPAFPQPIAVAGTGDIYNPSKDDSGMTLRDYAALKAMQALIISASSLPSYDRSGCITESLRYADEFLKAREQ